MATKKPQQMRVDCTECRFSEIASVDDDLLPADVLIEHANETGHQLSLSPHDPTAD